MRKTRHSDDSSPGHRLDDEFWFSEAAEADRAKHELTLDELAERLKRAKGRISPHALQALKDELDDGESKKPRHGGSDAPAA